MTKPLRLFDGKVLFDMNPEHTVVFIRPELEMIIEQKGNLLVCTACAGMGLDSHWYLVEE
ncbi:hypothetical protein [Vibrio aestuarianus]|uniref:hypothetical protein n=1 Tax=Vibrio aestuarianus TaxID=28171 RepID=UPI00237C8E5C|nr:hypothetical protein [Vibrio aestuarianus]MDE1237836.1 hypothetical protein [Vibrio aestuarianus]